MDVVPVVSDPDLLHSTGVISVAGGDIGTANGFAYDTRLLFVLILKNAGPATLTISGFTSEDGISRSILLSGSTTADTVYNFPGLRNSGGPMTLQASVADTCLVGVMPG